MGYFLLDIKVDNLMMRKDLFKNKLKNNETVLIDIGGHLKFIDDNFEPITNP